MLKRLIDLGNVRCLIAVGSLCANTLADEPYPNATPAEVNVSADAVELLGEFVQELVDTESVVGAELHVIKNRRTVFHKAYGWADREDQRALQIDATYCVRSMTKPLTGTAIQILIDEKKLSLDQLVSTILDEFDRPELRDVTIRHLLTHTSGLGLTAIDRPLAEYKSLREVAADAARKGCEFKPGTSFQYSDAGSDTLGAIVAAVTGLPPEQFISYRILRPLKMTNALTDIAGQSGDRYDIPSAYSGGNGNWQRHWQQTDAPLFPIFLTSQSLYCTTTDYARFLAMWMDDGIAEGRRLLSSEAVRRGLSSGARLSGYPVGFENHALTYGQQWMIYRKSDSSSPAIFGHNGSDGTHAWAWPEEDLIVLFFTQSRGTMSGIDLEAAIDRLLLQQDVAGYRDELQARRSAEKSLDRYEGIYWDEDSETDYYHLSIDKNRLVFERPGRLRAEAKPQPDAGKFIVSGGLEIEFEDATDDGVAPAMVMKTRRRTERQIRHDRSVKVPAIEDVLDVVSRAYAIDRLNETGVVELSGTIKMGLFGRKGQIRHWFDRRRFRTEIQIGSSTMMVVANGDEVAASASGGPLEMLEGITRQQEAISHPAIQYGGWRRGYDHLEVLKGFEQDGAKLVLVRATPNSLPGATFIVDQETGHINAEKRLTYLPGAGFVGQEVTYGDFRPVGVLNLPFHVESKFANPMIGRMEIQFDAFKLAVDPSELFTLPTE